MRNVIPVDAIYRIPDQAIDIEALVVRGIDKLGEFEKDRSLWMKRREEYYLGWDDYSSSVLKGLWDGSANFHYPLTEIQASAMHALVMQAVFFEEPWFFVDPQEEIDTMRIKKIEIYMKYVLQRYTNYHKGIYLAVDDWAWDLVTEGVGILSRGWQILQRRFFTVEKNQAFFRQKLDILKLLDDTPVTEFDRLATELVKRPYQEVEKIRTVFNGPIVIAEDPVFILFKGEVVDATDLNEHQTVIKVCHFDKNQLLSFKQSEYFDEEVVEKIIDMGPDIKGLGSSRGLYDRKRKAEDIQTGVNSRKSECDLYELICVYDTVSLNPRDKFSFEDRLQYYVHPKSSSLARWTYLDRISANGKIPLHMAHLFRRPRRSMGRGIVQTMKPIQDGVDILLNQSIDAGLLANNPMFAYKGDSTFDPGEIRAEPGLGVKCEDPNTDLRFFQWQANPNWSSNIQSMLVAFAQQLTALGPSQMGQVGRNVGPLRSTSGVNALDRNASVIHDVPIKRVKICMSDLFEGLYADCIDRMPDKLKITITGSGGVPALDSNGDIMKAEISPEELSKRVHFGLYANSKTMNRQTQREDAAAIAQFSFQKAPMELGIVGANEVYEILMNVHRAMGTPRAERFAKEPTQARALPLEMELKMIMQGLMPPIAPGDPEHETKLEVLEPILNSEKAMLEQQYGIVAPNAMDVLSKVIKEHTRYFEMLQKPSNLENPTGNNQSPTLGQSEEVKQPEPRINSGQAKAPNPPAQITKVEKGGE